MSEPKLRAAQRDRGASILEVIIVIAVISVIATALLSAVATFLRNDSDALNRVEETGDLAQLAAYLPSDVSSTPLTGMNTASGTATGCSGYTGGGTNALRLQWTETYNTTSNFEISYRVETVSGVKRLVRVKCSGTPALGAAQVMVIATNLDSTAPVTVTTNGGFVSMTVKELPESGASARTVTIRATSHNPEKVLTG